MENNFGVFIENQLEMEAIKLEGIIDTSDLLVDGKLPSCLKYPICLNVRNGKAIYYTGVGGTGTTLIRALQLDRKFIGIDGSKEYCEIANKRIQDELDQFKMEL
tara:strand:+ start:779 stop:1090 length:312 start_codon:yes stop_codon:yes gene_type:complete